MTTHTNNRFKNSTMVIKGNTIRWENHIIKTTSISQIWMGNSPNEQFPVPLALILFFIALSGASPASIIVMLLALVICLTIWLFWYRKQKDAKGINIEISSGNVYSFVSNNEEFTCQAFDVISDIITKNSIISNFQLNFEEDGKIIDNSVSTEEKTADRQILNIMSSGINEPIVKDLQKLSVSYTKKNEINEEILDLIEKTIQILFVDDKEELKIYFSKFIMLGLINDCNELGLNTLIEAIKKSIY